MRAARRLVLVLWADRWSIASAALMFGIAAVIVFNRVLTSAEITAMRTFLATRY